LLAIQVLQEGEGKKGNSRFVEEVKGHVARLVVNFFDLETPFLDLSAQGIQRKLVSNVKG